MGKLVRFSLLVILISSLTNSLFAKTPDAPSAIVILLPGEAAPVAKLLHIVTITAKERSEFTMQDLLANARTKAETFGANIIAIENIPGQKNQNLRFAFYHSPKSRNLETKIAWSPARLLSWLDFKGEIPAFAPQQVAAVTHCGIAYETNVCSHGKKVKISVYNQFDKEKSWVRDSEISTSVLQHEQGHFDLCELYCRKLRAEFAAVKITPENMKAILPAIFRHVEREYLASQEQYENETIHGTVAISQDNWTTFLSSQLAANAEFAGS